MADSPPDAPPDAPPAAAPEPAEAEDQLIGGEDETLEDPPLDIGDDTLQGGGTGRFDPSLEDPEFDRMGRHLDSLPPEAPPEASPEPAPAPSGSASGSGPVEEGGEDPPGQADGLIGG